MALISGLEVSRLDNQGEESGDELQELRVIHQLELVIGHHQSAHGQNLGSIYQILPSWMKHCDEF